MSSSATILLPEQKKPAYTGLHRYLPTKSDLICAGKGCAAGNDIAKFNWGSADSTPQVAAGVVCSAAEGGSAGCKILDIIFPPRKREEK